MNDSRQSQLEMRWIPVTDERGRTRMEAVWIDPSVVTAAHAA
ncbi:hypothetical protein [Nocardioides dongxiaopingii]|jgi:hypothetical protein|nr:MULTISPECIES: hypothetical protein [Nocardioides]